MTHPYYLLRNIEHPTPELYRCEHLPKERILLIGTHTRQPWATTIDPHPDSPADHHVSVEDCWRIFRPKTFEVVILDGVSNFVAPSRLPEFWRSVFRLQAARVTGRCIIGERVTLPGPMQRYPHPEPPPGVDWVELWPSSHRS